jgi:hypothetical protein
MENIINKINKYKYKLLSLEEQSGGKFIAKGAAGCITSPPLKCKHEQNNNSTDLVSKIIRPNDAKMEYNQASILKKIDPNQDYLIYPEKMCDIDPLEVTNSNIIKECTKDYKKNPLFGIKRENASLIYYKNGGVPYDKLNVEANQVYTVFESISHLLEGLNLMHSNDYVHMDIHIGNVVVKNLKPKFIDFGFGIEIKYFFNRIFTEYLKYNNKMTQYYPNFLNASQIYWPLELRLLSRNLLFETNEKIFDENILLIIKELLKNNWVNQLKDKILKITSYKLLINSNKTFLIKEPMQFCKEILNQVKPLFFKPEIIKSKEENKKSKPLDLILEKDTFLYELYSEILKKTDVYSIGILLINIYAYYIGQKEVKMQNNKSYIILNKKFDIINVDSINSKFLDDLYTNVTKPFTNFIAKLLHFNFKLRLSSGKIIPEYNILLPAIKKYVSDPEFIKLYKLR